MSVTRSVFLGSLVAVLFSSTTSGVLGRPKDLPPTQLWLGKSPQPDSFGLPAPLNFRGEDFDFTPSFIAPPAKTLPMLDSAGDDLNLYMKSTNSNTDFSKTFTSGGDQEKLAILTELENKCFSRVYTSDSEEPRLARLEQFVLGKMNKGNYDARLGKLHMIVLPAIITTRVSDTTSDTVPKKSESLLSVINHGIDSYNARDFHKAEDDFELCCAMAPDMARVHAYLAIAKLQINQRQAAIDEFRISYEIDPFGSYGRYAKECLLKLAGDEAIRKRGPVDSDKILHSSLDKINDQSSKLMALHSQEGNRMAQTRYASNPFFSASNGYADAQIQGTNARINAAERNAFTQESANNLKHLMGVKNKPGNAHLRAWGTDLNTRYYGDDTYLYAPYFIPREYPAELRAIQQSIASSQSHNNAPANTRSSTKAHQKTYKPHS